MRSRVRDYERQARPTEASLLLFVLLILVLGAALLLFAKGREAPADGAVVQINTAMPQEITRVLGVPASLGARIAAERTAQNGFRDVDALARMPVVPHPDAAADRLERAGYAPATVTEAQLADALGEQAADEATRERILSLHDDYPRADWSRLLGLPLIPPQRVSAASPAMAVRTWTQARNRFVFLCLALFLFFVLAHFLVRYARPNADPFLLPAVALLSTLGILLLFSLKDPVRDMTPYADQTLALVFGGGAALLLALSVPLARAPLHRYGYLYAVAALTGTVILGLFGTGPGGVKLSVAGTQPVEVIKILLVFFLAAYLAERGPVLNDPLRRLGPFPLPRRKDAAPLLVLYALALALFALVKDLGPVLLLFGAFLLLVYLATGRGIYVLLGLVMLLLGGALGYLLRFGVFQTRVDMWLSPWSNKHANGDQLALGLWALASGGPWGSGLGLGAPGAIPRGGSDLMFATLGEELGLIGALLVVACFFVIVGRGLRIARRAGSDFERLLASGLAGLLGLQAILILCGTLGILPLAGITLPFVSYGKSSLIASFFIIGMLLALSARTPAATVSPPRAYDVASARVVLFFTLFLGLAAVRLVWVQGIAANAVAGRTVTVPDSDGVRRPDVNPRLRTLAARIPRGRIFDRARRVLAENKGERRVYPFGAATGHLVGYVDPKVGGPAGMEARYDATLRGFREWRDLVPLWRGKDMPGMRLPRGADVTLALDAQLQQAALAALQRGAAQVRDRRTGRPKKRGAVVVLDVATGGVLAAVTLPTYNPGGLTPSSLRLLRANVNNDYPLINRALDGRYPPGSTFKIVTASALFDQNRADFTRNCAHVDTNVIWSAGGTTYARRRIVDDEADRPHGLVNLTEAIAQSCNIYFGNAGITLGAQALRGKAQEYGFTTLAPLNQFQAELPDIAFGQGPLLVSPLEMAGVAATVAAGGKRLRPQFIKAAGIEVTATPLSEGSAARLAEMMRRVTVSGTAAGRFARLPFPVAGKTGTAQNEEGDGMSHSWFIGFAPADRPRVAFAVVVENGGYGAAVAVPITREVLRQVAF